MLLIRPSRTFSGSYGRSPGRFLGFGLVALVVFGGWRIDLCQAEEPDAATRRAARQLAEEGGELLDAGRFREALDRASRAYQLVPAPTIKLLEGQIREELGELVEAAEAYESVIQEELPASAPPPYREAVKEARAALERLRPRIPQLTLVVEDRLRELKGLEVSLGGALVPLALLGQKRPTNPGRYEVVLSVGKQPRVRETVELRESEIRRLELALSRDSANGSFDNLAQESSRAGRSRNVWGWTLVGAGGVGLAIGATAGLIMMGKKSSLDDRCPSALCPESEADELSGFRTARTVSWVGWAAGLGALGTGTVLLLLPSHSPAQRVALRPMVGMGSLGLSGQF